MSQQGWHQRKYESLFWEPRSVLFDSEREGGAVQIQFQTEAVRGSLAGARRRCACRSLAYTALLLACIAGCASAGAEFRPYLRSAPHPAILTRAVTADRGDVRALARVGAIIIGNIKARGNEFAGAASVEEAAALEAAQRGGTHLVAEAASPSEARPARQPGSPITLTFLVIRLANKAALAQLPARLQPRRGVHYVGRLAIDPTETESIAAAPQPVKPLATTEASELPVHVVDGSHLKPLP